MTALYLGRLWRNGKCAAMAVHDLSRHCESKPRAFASGFVVKNVAALGRRLWGNARALIGHAEKQHFCTCERHLTDAPAVMRRRLQQQIDQGLLEQPGIRR